jgi:ketosteroid isomerase-like protein
MINRTFLLLALITTTLFAGDKDSRIDELNAYWTEVSRTVNEGDFEGYRATCHPDGILISGSKSTCYPLADALKKWKVEFDETKAGKIKASVEFRLSKRWGDATTAHETGMFCYSATDADGQAKTAYIFLEALLIKKDGKWLILMENQKSEGTIEDWNKLQPASSK